MSVLKKLRNSRKLSLEDLSKKIEIPAADLEKWEKVPHKVPENGLSSLGYYFGVSSEELKDAIEDEDYKLTTSDYYLCTDSDFEDGWWGHFGLRLHGQKKSTWFPITLGMANRVSSQLETIASRDEWIIVETLNNRALVLKPVMMNRLWLLDEAADQPADDWEIPWDGYAGKPGEFYKALEGYYWENSGMEQQECVPEKIKRDVEVFTDIHDLDLEQVAELVIETRIYTADGNCFSINPEESRITELIEGICLELPRMIFDFSDGNSELYIPSENIFLIDIPKRLVDLAFRESVKVEEANACADRDS